MSSGNQYHGRNLAHDTLVDDASIIRVGSGSDPQSVASAISNAFYESTEVTMRAVGAAAVNQAVKAIAISRGYIAPRGLDVNCRVGFTNVESRNGKDPISAIVFRLSLD
jgi:stage V sporulation protein S